MKAWPILLLLMSTAAHAADGWEPRLGASLPSSTVFKDERGHDFALAQEFAAGGAPVVLDFGYFHCPSLCGLVRADLLAALGGSGLRSGRDYRVLVISIDPSETPHDAATAKAADLRAAGAPDGAAWHYLTGQTPAVSAVADAAGFRFRFDPVLKQFAHPTGVVVLTGDGRVADTIGGLGFGGTRLRDAVLGAAAGGIAPPSLPVLLLCHFDAVTGRYTLATLKMLRLMAVLTVLTLGGVLWSLHRTGHAPR